MIDRDYAGTSFYNECGLLGRHVETFHSYRIIHTESHAKDGHREARYARWLFTAWNVEEHTRSSCNELPVEVSEVNDATLQPHIAPPELFMSPRYIYLQPTLS
jgi:hypothetical protein